MLRGISIAILFLLFLGSANALVFGLPEEKIRVIQPNENELGYIPIVFSPEQPYALVEFDSNNVSRLRVRAGDRDSVAIAEIPTMWLVSEKLEEPETASPPGSINISEPYQRIVFSKRHNETLQLTYWISNNIPMKFGAGKTFHYSLLIFSEKPGQAITVGIDLVPAIEPIKPVSGEAIIFLLVFVGVMVVFGFVMGIKTIEKQYEESGILPFGTFLPRTVFGAVFLGMGLAYFLAKDFFYAHIANQAFFIFLNEILVLVVIPYLAMVLFKEKPRKNNDFPANQPKAEAFNNWFRWIVMGICILLYGGFLLAVSKDAIITVFLTAQLLVAARSGRPVIANWMVGLCFLFAAMLLASGFTSFAGVPEERYAHSDFSPQMVAVWMIVYYFLKTAVEVTAYWIIKNPKRKKTANRLPDLAKGLG